MKGGKAAGQQDSGEPEAVSESDTGEYVSYEDAAVNYGMNPPEKLETEGENWERSSQSGYEESEGGDYETPHPEGITSICYSCTEYETCNVKTGTCTKCDKYKNRAEAYKTEEQKYSEEQDKIDRETKKKLREMADEEKMNNIPSDAAGQQSNGKKFMRAAGNVFERIMNGTQSFMIVKRDEYKVGDEIIIEEFSEGKATGRMLAVIVSYLEDDTVTSALETGYCIINIIEKAKEGGQEW